MKLFMDGAPLRLSLPWLPRLNVDEGEWKHALGDRVEDAKLYHLIGSFNRYEVCADRIHFYMHPPLRKNALLKALRNDKHWLDFMRNNPEAELVWAEDLAEDNA